MYDAIKIDSLSKTFKGKKSTTVEALKELCLTVGKGEVFGFLGPNGAGKSTTIKILMGLLFPSSGAAFLSGVSVSDPAARKSLGYLPENPSFYDFLTAREYLDFIGSSFAMKATDIAERTNEVLEMLQLAEAADRPVRSFSKGMVQRLGIAQTLLHDPDVYILDEPMSGLDPIGRSLVKDIIRRLKIEGKTVFFSTHITADVEAVCDRVGIIARGRLEALDTVENIMRSGIVGYTVQVSGADDIFLDGCVLSETSGAFREYEVSRGGFNAFVAAVAARGGRMELIETKRKDLEEFFLEIVQRDNASA